MARKLDELAKLGSKAPENSLENAHNYLAWAMAQGMRAQAEPTPSSTGTRQKDGDAK